MGWFDAFVGGKGMHCIVSNGILKNWVSKLSFNRATIERIEEPTM